MYESSLQWLKIYINIINKWVIKNKIKSLPLSMIFLLFIILKTCKTTSPLLTSINKLSAPNQPTIFISMYILIEQSNSFSLSLKPGHFFFLWDTKLLHLILFWKRKRIKLLYLTWQPTSNWISQCTKVLYKSREYKSQVG